MAIEIKRGDACSIAVDISLGGTPVTESDIETAEFMLGTLRRVYPGEVSYNAGLGAYLLPLSQEDSFSLPAGTAQLDIRVKLPDGSVSGLTRPIPVRVAPSVSEEVL